MCSVAIVASFLVGEDERSGFASDGRSGGAGYSGYGGLWAKEAIDTLISYIAQVRGFLKCLSISSLRSSPEKSEASP
jgi:hypothetical protein